MTEFLDAFKAMIGYPKRGCQVAFANRAGISKGYVTDIMKGGIPTPSSLDQWLTQYGLPEDERKRMVAICSSEKARQQRDAMPAIALLEEKREGLKALVTDLVGLVRQKGMKVPDEFLKRLEAL